MGISVGKIKCFDVLNRNVRDKFAKIYFNYNYAKRFITLRKVKKYKFEDKRQNFARKIDSYII